MSHAHPHPHGSAQEHGHAPAAGSAARRRLGLVLALTLGFALVEALGGWWSGSLALLSDAGHMLADSSALALSYAAAVLTGRNATWQRTYGYRRAELMAALVNAISLLLLAFWIVAEAIDRLQDPAPVMGGAMAAVAAVGLGVNLLALRLLHGEGAGLNVAAAFWHVLGDLLGSVGALGAALVIALTGWVLADPLVSIGIALLVAGGSLRIVWQAGNLLLDRVPPELDALEIHQYLETREGVREVCDLHVWGVSSTEAMLTAHLVLDGGTDRDAFLPALLTDLKARYGLAHMTVQLETESHASCPRGW